MPPPVRRPLPRVGTARSSVTAIVPLNALMRAKGRLAGHLDADTRRALTEWMFHRVIDACLGARSIGDVLVVAGDAEGAALAPRPGVRAVQQDRPGLAAALALADELLGGEQSTLVVAADLPLVMPADLDLVCDSGWGGGRASGVRGDPVVVVAPTLDGGTGALLRRPGAVVPTAYGSESAARHLALARDAGIRAVRADVEGLALDVDTASQLRSAGELDAGVEVWAAALAGGRVRCVESTAGPNP